MKDIAEPNYFHIRILYYLMLNHPKKIKSHYEIAHYYKKGNVTSYKLARKELEDEEHIIEFPEGFCLNLEREEYKIFAAGVKQKPKILTLLKEKQEKYLNRLLNKDYQKFYEDLYKDLKE